jgi:tryptophan synthase alpha subunit
VAQLADAVIVGSAVVATIEQSLGSSEVIARVGRFVGGLRVAVT